MVKQIRIEVLNEFDPSRTTRGYHRQLAACCNPFEQFIAFFQNGKVGSELSVKHLVESQSAQSRHHLASHSGPRLLSELFANRGADSRSCLHYHVFLWVLNRRPDLVHIVPFHDRAYGANRRALTAVDAFDVRYRRVERRADSRLETSVRREQHADFLYLLADRHAPSAQHAFAGISHQRGRRFVDYNFRFFSGIRNVPYAEVLREFLQLAVKVARACRALHAMVGQQQFHNHFSARARKRRVGLDDHALRDREHARRLQRPLSHHFHHTHPAGSYRLHILEITKRGYVYSDGFRGFQNRCPLRNRHCLSIDA